MRRAADWLGVVAAFIVVIVVNVLSNTLPINGRSMPEISAMYPSLFTPAGFTFSIWGVIYLGLLLFVVYQALPAQRDSELLAKLSPWFIASCVGNAMWLLVWHYNQLALSLLIMIGILCALVRIYRLVNAPGVDLSRLQGAVVRVPFSLYTAWITVATIVNLSAVQTGYGWDGIAVNAVTWTLLKLAVAGSIAAAVLLRRGDIVFGLVVAWAAFGIAVKQAATPMVAGAAEMLVYALALCTLLALASRVTAKR